MSKRNDFQRSKAYRWEDVVLHQSCKAMTTFAEAQAVVDYVWQAEGLSHPPKVKPIARNVKTKVAHANRLEIFISEKGIKTTILLHEIAHSMTPGHSHGPRWLGMFFILLGKHARMDVDFLCKSAECAGLKVSFEGESVSREYSPI